jgi:Uma2 family endonuclease
LTEVPTPKGSDRRGKFIKTAAASAPRFDAVHRFTVDDYYRMVDAGVLPEARTTELLDGQIVPLAQRGPERQWALAELNKAFVLQSAERFRVGSLASLVIAPHDVPEPDLALYRPGLGRFECLTKDAFLVVGVAEGELTTAMKYKAGLYRRAKIPEYWVVDLRHRCLHVFTLAGKRYRK